jgi:hypothetical protein
LELASTLELVNTINIANKKSYLEASLRDFTAVINIREKELLEEKNQYFNKNRDDGSLHSLYYGRAKSHFFYADIAANDKELMEHLIDALSDSTTATTLAHKENHSAYITYLTLHIEINIQLARTSEKGSDAAIAYYKEIMGVRKLINNIDAIFIWREPFPEFFEEANAEIEKFSAKEKLRKREKATAENKAGDRSKESSAKRDELLQFAFKGIAFMGTPFLLVIYLNYKGYFSEKVNNIDKREEGQKPLQKIKKPRENKAKEQDRDKSFRNFNTATAKVISNDISSSSIKEDELSIFASSETEEQKKKKEKEKRALEHFYKLIEETHKISEKISTHTRHIDSYLKLTEDATTKEKNNNAKEANERFKIFDKEVYDKITEIGKYSDEIYSAYSKHSLNKTAKMHHDGLSSIKTQLERLINDINKKEDKKSETIHEHKKSIRHTQLPTAPLPGITSSETKNAPREKAGNVKSLAKTAEPQKTDAPYEQPNKPRQLTLFRYIPESLSATPKREETKESKKRQAPYHPNSMWNISFADSIRIATSKAFSIAAIGSLEDKDTPGFNIIKSLALQSEIIYCANALRTCLTRRQDPRANAWGDIRHLIKHFFYASTPESIINFSRNELPSALLEQLRHMRVNRKNLGLSNEADIKKLAEALNLPFNESFAICITETPFYQSMDKYLSNMKTSSEHAKMTDQQYQLLIFDQFIPLINSIAAPLLAAKNASDSNKHSATPLAYYDESLEILALKMLFLQAGEFFHSKRTFDFKNQSLKNEFRSFLWSLKNICNSLGHETPQAISVLKIIEICESAKKINNTDAPDLLRVPETSEMKQQETNSSTKQLPQPRM